MVSQFSRHMMSCWCVGLMMMACELARSMLRRRRMRHTGPGVWRSRRSRGGGILDVELPGGGIGRCWGSSLHHWHAARLRRSLHHWHITGRRLCIFGQHCKEWRTQNHTAPLPLVFVVLLVVRKCRKLLAVCPRPGISLSRIRVLVLRCIM